MPIGKPTHDQQGGEVWVRRGGMGTSHSGTAAHKRPGKPVKPDPPDYVRPTHIPKWANKYLARPTHPC